LHLVALVAGLAGVLGLALVGFVVIALLTAGHDRPTTAVDDAAASPPGDRVAQPARRLPQLADPGGRMTERRARKLARTWFELRDPARYRNDDGTLAQLETGTALVIDTAVSEEIRCGCIPNKHRHILRSIRVVVPPSPVRSFAAQFTSVTPKGVPASYRVVFTKDAEGWQASLVTFEEDPGVMGASAPGDRARSTTGPQARRHLRDLGRYLYAAHVTGRPAKGRRGSWDGLAPRLAKDVAAESQDQGRNDILLEVIGPRPTGQTYAFPTDRGLLVCGALRTRFRYSTEGGLLVQDLTRRNWGRSIAPGRYEAITSTSIHATCMTVAETGTRDLHSYYGVTLGSRGDTWQPEA
jgi:hypothetical protein